MAVEKFDWQIIENAGSPLVNSFPKVTGKSKTHVVKKFMRVFREAQAVPKTGRFAVVSGKYCSLTFRQI